MLAATIGNLLLRPIQNSGSDFGDEPLSSGSAGCSCTACPVWGFGGKTSREFEFGEFNLTLTGFFAFDPS